MSCAATFVRQLIRTRCRRGRHLGREMRSACSTIIAARARWRAASAMRTCASFEAIYDYVVLENPQTPLLSGVVAGRREPIIAQISGQSSRRCAPCNTTRIICCGSCSRPVCALRMRGKGAGRPRSFECKCSHAAALCPGHHGCAKQRCRRRQCACDTLPGPTLPQYNVHAHPSTTAAAGSSPCASACAAEGGGACGSGPPPSAAPTAPVPGAGAASKHTLYSCLSFAGLSAQVTSPRTPSKSPVPAVISG